MPHKAIPTILKLCRLICLTLACALPQVAHAEAMLTDAAARSLFQKAGTAYDENRLHEAIESYEQLITSGFRPKELFFNLGNAYFRSGQPGKAVLNYRRAWRIAPRDADIEANMRFALEHTTASPPDTPFIAGWMYRLSKKEWINMAIISYWLACALGIGVVLRVRWFDVLKRISLASLMLMLIALLSVYQWGKMDKQPEHVVTAKDQKALFAPLEDSTEHFPIPEGSIVRMVNRQDGWLEIAAGERTGWLPANACEMVNAL